jgi:hypothetical protein
MNKGKLKQRRKPTTIRENRPGPKAEVLKIDMDWKDAVKLAMQKRNRPKAGRSEPA